MEIRMNWATKQATMKNIKIINILINKTLTVILSCRGRDRTSTRQLAIAQSSVVDPGRIPVCTETRLYAMFILLSSPPRQGGMSAKNFITPQFLRTNMMQI